MPEKEARPPAQNRHGGAPRGERVPLDARRASPGVDGRASRARQQKTCAFRRSARPSWGWMEKREAKPGRKNAPRKRRRLCWEMAKMEYAATSSYPGRARARARPFALDSPTRARAGA